jgi:hypothetical protein
MNVMELQTIYTQYQFPSFDKFKQILKRDGHKYTDKQIRQFINGFSPTTEVHKKTNDNKQMHKFIIASKPSEMVQIDLIDFQKYAKTNNGYKYLLVGIDVFTRYGFAYPIKNKTPTDVLDAFMLLSNAENIISVFHDSGNEFKGVFLNYLNNHNILDLKAEIGDHKTLGIVDRFCQTLKRMITRYMTHYKTTKYFDKMVDFVNTYNNTPHSSLNDIAPIHSTEPQNYKIIQQINLAKMKFNKSVSTKIKKAFNIGDYVRVKLKKKAFQKGYEVTYSRDIYQIESISGDRATLNDGQKVKFENLLRSSNNMIVEDNEEKNQLDKESRIKRKLHKEGLL